MKPDPGTSAAAPLDLETDKPLLAQSLAESLAWVASIMAAIAFGYIAACILWHGFGAVRLHVDASHGLSVSGLGHELGTVPVLLTAPMMLMARHLAKQGRLRHGGFWLSVALFALGLMTVVPRGIHSPGWYLQPLLTILVAVTFGVVPGLLMAIVGAVVLLLTALAQESRLLSAPMMPQGVWHTALAVVAVILATGLLGSIAHKVVWTAIRIEIEHRKRLAETLATLRDRERLLRHVMRVETVGSMAGLVAHQLRNQMQVVLGYAGLGERSAEAERAGYFRRIVESVKQTNSLLQQLLDLAHPAPASARLVDLTEHVGGFVDQARRLMPAGIQLESDITTEPAPVWLDPGGLTQALWNLVLNSKQAMQGNGRVRIVLQCDATEARIRIADSGVGIRPEHLPLIFRPYFTTKPKGEGTGLGLAAVDRFVRGANGRIEVRSEVGKGTEFTLAFPKAAVPTTHGDASTVTA